MRDEDSAEGGGDSKEDGARSVSSVSCAFAEAAIFISMTQHRGRIDRGNTPCCRRLDCNCNREVGVNPAGLFTAQYIMLGII